MVRYLPSVLVLAGVVQSACSSAAMPQNTTSQLLISGSGYIWSANFDGASVILEKNISESGVTPSWLIEGKRSKAFIANDENSNATYKYTFDVSTTNTSTTSTSHVDLIAAQKYSSGSAGVVHFAYNVNKTRLFGAGYGSQKIDVWDTTAEDGSLSILKTIPINDTNSHPHQTVISPTGNIAIVNDLGLDKLHVLDVSDDNAISIASSVSVPTGCGPRHGAFYWTTGMSVPSRYLVACETSHSLLVFNITQSGDLQPEPIQTDVQTAVDTSGAQLTAAELLLYVNDDRSADVYVSNRLTGGATDSIAHFRLSAPTTAAGTQPGELVALTAADMTSSGGVGPRGMSLSASGAHLFVGNQQAGPAGLVVLTRDAATGDLGASPVASVDYDDFAGGQGAQFGPQFVMEWSANGFDTGVVMGAKTAVGR
ncbi:hypothetical protein N0V82_007852 [Gnomoniopsis sp. IMI 355080]|nr:hypothetical protein N0V82_007852 [Gnomoniopsis sp. IMI 355080]